MTGGHSYANYFRSFLYEELKAMREDSVCDSIRKIEEKNRHKAVSVYDSLGITYSQIRILLDIRGSEAKEFSIKEAQEALGVTQPTATGIVARLERGGFVKSHQPKSDRRVKLIRLTKKGEEACNVVEDYMDGLEKKIEKALTEEENEMFKQMLKKICEA